MVAGRVVRFDGARGYGFIAPETGGEDVFLHVNDLLIPESFVRSGVAVEFEVEDGERGLKASSVRLAHGAEAPPPMRSSVPRPSGIDLDDPMCDVLSEEEYTRDVTELLLKTAPWLTGDQIVQIRQQFVRFGKGHGWIED
ncbi:cold-shock protein [Actinacidiphila guanduensis]|jgi:cold shock CspA family protein|uniref:Cold-shock DNA-binding protein family n=1 Tax=Actinacidiphila guanduensis TaxID=310781 RepID=A0A1H0HP57_9ACTN|nr:cold shock domain-containing protein [Actinacidiphila guanduensis]SDO20601.1 cold-shock DNA-binding protein family [Actinacidiphila guanduensis]